MLLYVDLEHREYPFRFPAVWPAVAFRRLRAKYRLETLTDELCLIVRYHRLADPVLQALPISRVIFSSFNTPLTDYPAEELAEARAWLREPHHPTLAIGNAMELLVTTHGGDYDRASAPENAEMGFHPVSFAPGEPLALGLGSEPRFYQHHHGQARRVPDTFAVVASSARCPIQAIRHVSLPLVGVQFHPEDWDQGNEAGKVLLTNFLATTASRAPHSQGQGAPPLEAGVGSGHQILHSHRMP